MSAPNVVFIITDNQSPWTMGCYGNDEIRTPRLDAMAAEGVRADHAFCVNPVCSPNRASYLTGKIPSQHGVHSWLGVEKPCAQMGPDAYCTIEEFATLPQLLADQGYTCGLTGKWHLGDSIRPQLGFDYWYTKPKGHTHTFYGEEAIWQGEVHAEPRYMTDVITEHGVDFIGQQAGSDAPFFLYIGYNAPYGLDHDMLDGHRNRHAEHYADKDMHTFPREPMHPDLRNYQDRIGNITAMRSYAAAVSGVDDGVGRVLDRLEELGMAEDTLVIYTADHGLLGGHHGLWGMGDHSRPRHMVRESMQVPLLLRHPARLPAGTVMDRMVCTYDLYPTLVDYLALHAPADPDLPGRSYGDALLTGDGAADGDAVFHEYGPVRAVQTANWKLILRHPAGPHELYDLQADPDERANLYDAPGVAEAQAAMTARLDAFFARYVDPQYDLWRGGRSKAGPLND